MCVCVCVCVCETERGGGELKEIGRREVYIQERMREEVKTADR